MASESASMADNQAILDALTQMASDFSGYEVDELLPTQTFLENGFDSLFLTQLATAFQKEFGVEVTFRQLIDDVSTLEKLAAYIGANADEQVLSRFSPTQEPEMSTEQGAPAEPQGPTAHQSAAQHLANELGAATSSNMSSDGLAHVLAQQVALMSEQLSLLQTARNQAAGKTNKAASAPAVKAQAPSGAAKSATASDDKPSLPAGFGPSGASRDLKITKTQQRHIDRLVERYVEKTSGSKERTQQDRQYHADPRTAAGFNRLWKEMVYPIVVNKSLGAHLWDVDGNKYVDLLNGFGPNFFGHRAPFIVEALRNQLDDGYEVGPQTPNAGTAAKLLCELTGMDRVSWVNTGSEAVQAAMRVARTVTGRDKIALFKGDYHGNFDEVLVRGVKGKNGYKTMPLAPGIPFGSVDNIVMLDYGEESALECLKNEAGDIAAVLVEPVQSRRPEFQPKEFLHKLRDLTRESGIALVFDEVITGFRLRPGGAQEYFGIEADMATYGKVIGGGMPIGAIAGRKEFMDTFDGGHWQYGDQSMPTAGVTFFAGTFVRHPFAIAAAQASLQYLKNAGPALQEGVNKNTTRLATRVNEIFASYDIGIEVVHFSSQMFFRVLDDNPLTTLFFYHMRDRGVHMLEGLSHLCYCCAH